MKNIVLLGVVLIGIVGGFFAYNFFVRQEEVKNVSTYEECVAAGFPSMESYPPQCRTSDMLTFSSMKKLLLPAIFLIVLSISLLTLLNVFPQNRATGAPPYDGSGQDNVTESEEEALLRNWKRPEGPAKVALQVGHLKNEEVPDELHRLRGNTGATGGGMTEAEVNEAIAVEAKTLLETQGIIVEILPATVPENYWADVFVAIHADGSEDILKSGYKLASPRRDSTGNSAQLSKTIEKTYGETTGLVLDPNVTRNMTGYYAFSWRRYDHAVHPMTASIILETGFLTSPSDRELIVDQPEVSAEGLAKGVIEYLTSENLL